MSSTSEIEWTDVTWNPVVGCKLVSPGCVNCYAEVMSKRLAAMARKDIADGKNPGRKAHYLNVMNDKGRWAGNVVTVPEALTDPLGWKKPRRVFVNSMSDLFHADVPFAFIDQVFAVMALCPQHTFQILTKRPERMAEYLNDYRSMCGLKTDENIWKLAACMDGKRFTAAYKPRIDDTGVWSLNNVWLGASIEDQARADERIPHLLKCPATVRFLSAEPLLGPIDLTKWLATGGIHWVIAGGES